MIETFLKTIISDFHLEQQPLEQQQKAIELVSKRMEETLIHTSLSLMPKEELVELEKFLDTKPGTEQLENYLLEEAVKIPNLDKAITQALLHEYEMLKAMYTAR